MLPGGLCCCWDWGQIWPTIVQRSLAIWSQSIDANLHKRWVKRHSCCDFQDWSRSCLSWCVIPLMHFWDIALKWNVNLQNEISPFQSWNVCSSKHIPQHESAWPPWGCSQVIPSSKQKRKSFIAFFRYGVSERRVQKPMPPPVSCRRWGATMRQMKTYRCLRSKFFTFHRGAVVKVMKELIVSWQFDCTENAVVFHFHFYDVAQTLFRLSSFLMVIAFGKKGGCFALLICWA